MAFTPFAGNIRTTPETRRAFFTDSTLPPSAASAGAQYIVRGQRSTRLGDASDAVIVQFGVDGNGERITSASIRAAA